ncbi:MAG: hypothetical protein V1649_00600 [Patescibacteria group bacterium]
MAFLEKAVEVGEKWVEELSRLENRQFEEEVHILDTILKKTKPVIKYCDRTIFDGKNEGEFSKRGLFLVNKYDDQDEECSKNQLIITREGVLYRLKKDRGITTQEVVSVEETIREYGLDVVLEGLIFSLKETLRRLSEHKYNIEQRLDSLAGIKLLLKD